MQVSKITVAKYVFFGCAVVGLVGWNVHLQNDLHEERQQRAVEPKNEVRQKRSVSQPNQPTAGGALFTRWGRSTCPDDDSELVYAGIAGGSLYTDVGGGAEYLCLARDVQFGNGATAAVEGTARIYGVELQPSGGLFSTKNSAPSSLVDSDVICAVCRSKSHSTQVMIPGRKECYPGWKRQYWGYLMTEHYAHKAWHSYACVDEAPEAEEKGHKNDNGALMYNVQGICGSLSCPNYVNGFELTCVVCTK